jgi:hypothetical protein
MKNALAYISILVAIVVVGVLVVAQPAGEVTLFGAGDDAFSYRHYSSANASSTAGTVVYGGAGVLGAVHINTATATAQVIVYDGASSATSGLSVIAKFPPLSLGGTYALDVAVTKGVVVELPASFTGDITFSVR